ncbi:hypothetical protein O181_096938, partial [Austropuccinia psidii MF-1]|nr:hypothetical protein [Austropuccinia psidii MF-1]
MGDSIREESDEEQDPRDEFLVEYQEETLLEIQDIQLEAGMSQDTANKNLCKNTQDAQTFLVTPTKGLAYINGTATKMTVCIHNAQHPFIIDSGPHSSIVARNYLESHFPNWEKQLFPTKAKNFKSPSGKMTPKFLLETDYQRIYGIDIYNSKNRHINIGTNKEKKFSLDIYQISSQDQLEELLKELIEG